MMLETIYHKFLECGIVSTDTRNLPKGCLYIALKGKNFNGNTFASEALKQGAAYSIVDEPEFANSDNIYLVDDSLKFLQKLAQRYRQDFNIPFIGITGSNGKTTTKELLYSVLSKKYKTHVTKGNLNNHIGLPLTILSMPADTEMAVIEMGANKIGDNAELCEIFNPNFGIITNIGKEHLEGFGNLEGVAKGNSELFYHIQKNNGTAFVNLEQEHVSRMANRLEHTYTYAFSPKDADCCAEITTLNPSISLLYENSSISSSLFGAYNAENIMTAIAIGTYFKVPIAQIKSGIEEYVPANNRSQIIDRNTNHIIVDCYNANPSSMEVSINNFMTMKTNKSKKVLILGDMYETGAYENEEHETLIKMIQLLKPDELYICGKAFGVQKHLSPNVWFNTSEELKHFIREHPIQNAAIFIKGSRGMQMEKVLESL